MMGAKSHDVNVKHAPRSQPHHQHRHRLFLRLSRTRHAPFDLPPPAVAQRPRQGAVRVRTHAGTAAGMSVGTRDGGMSSTSGHTRNSHKKTSRGDHVRGSLRALLSGSTTLVPSTNTHTSQCPPSLRRPSTASTLRCHTQGGDEAMHQRTQGPRTHGAGLC